MQIVSCPGGCTQIGAGGGGWRVTGAIGGGCTNIGGNRGG